MAIHDTLRLILDHPLTRNRRLAALTRYIRWQLGLRLLSARVLVDWFNGAQLLVGRGESGVLINVYCGLHEFEDMGFLLHLCRSGDGFVDVGANAGAYTVLACAGAGAQGIAIEPAPTAFQRLTDNVAVNNLGERVLCHNIGLGDREGVLAFSTGLDCLNHVIADEEPCVERVEVPVRRLDDVLNGEKTLLLKIDVEGYETQVLRGAVRTLEDSSLLAVIMELNGSGARYGFDEEALHRTVLEKGFSTFRYDPFSRNLSPLDGKKNTLGNNTLYVKTASLEKVRRRLKDAPRYSIHGWNL